MATDDIILLKVDKSSIHGYGVFAMTDIKKGEIILESTYIETTGCKGEIEKYYFQHPKGRGRTILPLDRIAIMNSSKTPNVKCEIGDKIVATALKNIKCGEELLWKYKII